MDKNTLYYLTFARLGYITTSLPALATTFAVAYSVMFDFHGSTATHCHVPNILPSISAAIGRTPQQYIWRIFISLHAAPRFLCAMSYYGWHKQVHVGAKQSTYIFLVKTAILLHIIENMMLVFLTCISSSDNRGIHENSFIVFIITSWMYMLLTIGLCKWSRKYSGKSNKTYNDSYKYKKLFAFCNISAFSLAVYLYFRHNWYCEPYIYSWFALCEYVTIFTNILFHGTAIMDFREYSAAVVLTDLIQKHK
ncbi:post-GPI attachment to proteins factor 2-like [Ruditapes philippinarum]|uniref:post-GPI attachment to proteins factor 2-like n=1 Tax=Ruditapes philippinarum TaxID=129788 RepID=UPI00295ADBF5|nr:post-GPI attachment to proteins factor 2-like [Ruditapes philippinarum]